jgi:two-component system phosphate regulon response regulator OmpR
MSEQPHILIVDDDDRLRDLLRRFLTEPNPERHTDASQSYVVITAGDAADAERKLAALAIDLIVLDVMMPGVSGLELTAKLRRSEATAKIPILLLTAQGAAADRIAGLEAGADDYLPKPFEPRELLLRINAILRRAPVVAARANFVRLGRWQFDFARAELRSETETLPLSEVEASLLRVLAAASGTSFSREELSARSAIGIAPRSVDVQVVRLRRKIEDNPRLPRYLQTVRGEGYVLRPDDG